MHLKVSEALTQWTPSEIVIAYIESVFLHQRILSATLVDYMNLGSALDLVGFNLFDNFMDTINFSRDGLKWHIPVSSILF